MDLLFDSLIFVVSTGCINIKAYMAGQNILIPQKNMIPGQNILIPQKNQRAPKKIQ
jgi:hypothetical protein